jgi:regulator of cell morphogenesis and NO signaling
MKLELDTPVGQLVAERPDLATVLERFGIDFCCGGRQTLAEAAGPRTPELMECLSAACLRAPTQESWQERPLGELIDHIVRVHHDYLRHELPALRSWMARCVAVHAAPMPELLEMQDVLADLAEELEMHTFKEEQVVFPALCRQEGLAPELRELLESEHEHAGACLRRLRELSADYLPPAGACGTLRALYAGLDALEKDLHRHIHLENNVLFPRA